MRKPNARVVLNRERLSQVGLAVADGLEHATKAIVENADPPDATPYGQGLVTTGGWLVYHRGKKVAGGSLSGKQPSKPRSYRPTQTDGISAIAGYGFPGRFQETGTAHHPAQPFLWLAWLKVEPRLESIMAPAVRAHMARFRS
jgi:hypothetical protein